MYQHEDAAQTSHSMVPEPVKSLLRMAFIYKNHTRFSMYRPVYILDFHLVSVCHLYSCKNIMLASSLKYPYLNLSCCATTSKLRDMLPLDKVLCSTDSSAAIFCYNIRNI